MNLKYELYRIISGIGTNSTGNLIEAAADYLGKSKETSRGTKANEFTKDQEAAQLIYWIDQSDKWFYRVDEERFIARGAEQRVYLDEDTCYVVKLNHSVFYEYWLDYFHNLLIHNYLFPQTAYELLGFHLENEMLHAVVKQSFIEITEPTDPSMVKNFLLSNGFQWKKNND